MYGTTWESLQKLNILFEPLLVSGSDKEPIPGAAESWTVSEDGRIYSFKLRKEGAFSDGHPVTAQDFVLGFQRIVSPEVGRLPKPNYLLGNIKNAQAIIDGKMLVETLGVRAISAHELEIELIEPAGYFSSILTYPGLAPVPSHKIEEFGEAWSDIKNFVSNGPMRLESANSLQLIYIKNEGHWSDLNYDKLVTNLLKEQNDATKDLLVGKSDLALNVRKNQKSWASTHKNLRYFSGNLNSVHYGIFNTKKISDKRVRKALWLATDRQVLAKGFGYVPASTFTPKSLWPAININASKTDQVEIAKRQIEARKLLKDAGYDASNPFKIEILVFKALDHDRLATGLKSMWSAIGVETEISVLDTKPFVNRVYSGDFVFCIGYWFGDYEDPMAFLSLLREGATKNFTGWSSPQYNDLLDQAILEPKLQKRFSFYDQMENIIYDEAPVLPFVNPVFDVISSQRILSAKVGLHGLNLRSITLR